MYASAQRLSELCDLARETGRIGLDLEFIRDRTYFPQLALVQIAVEEHCVLVDPLDESIDLAPLEQLVLDPDVTKVLHAATQDMEIFFLRTGKAPRNIFDTQIAGALVGLGSQISYAALVSKVLGQHIDKGQTLTDWLQRPLSEKQEEYALNDVVHLLPIHDHLQSKLTELDRESWIREECSHYEQTSLYDPEIETIVKRIRRAGTLKGRAVTVLLELAEWREREAKERDRPRRNIIADEPLVEIARSAPKNVKGVERIRGIHPSVARRSAADIVETVKRGLAVPERERPAFKERTRLDDETALAVDLLDACLRSFCHRADIAPAMVSKRSHLERLVAEHKLGDLDRSKNPITSGWRGELVGNDLLEVLEGRIAIYFNPETGRPEFESR